MEVEKNKNVISRNKSEIFQLMGFLLYLIQSYSSVLMIDHIVEAFCETHSYSIHNLQMLLVF